MDPTSRPTLRLLALSLWVTGCATCPVCPVCPEEPDPVEVAEPEQPQDVWFVLKVIDGDTLVARLEGARIERKETVRLLNIDTPERGEPGFVEATEALKYLVRSARIRLEFEDPMAEKRDNFGRLLVYVISQDVNANLELVRQGWSSYYTKYGKGRLASEFVEAEAQAREAAVGLWGAPFVNP